MGLVAIAVSATSVPCRGEQTERTPARDLFFKTHPKVEKKQPLKSLSLSEKLKLESPIITRPRALMVIANQATVFYIVAHQDDASLFMYSNGDISNPNVKVVFVYTTAGDGGLGNGPTAPPGPYFVSRERGAQQAIEFLADLVDITTGEPSSESVLRNNHPVFRRGYRNTVSYYMRLPDGNIDGNGFPGTGNVSMTKLHAGSISSLTAIDGSTTYNGWSDVVNTLREIITAEATGSPVVWLNIPDPDPTSNPGDHPDHLATGLASSAAQATLPCVNMALYVGYAVSGQNNLDYQTTEDKTGTFANVVNGKTGAGWAGNFDAAHKDFLAGMLYRIVDGNGQACNF